jgi:hypothetical protein
MSQQNDDLTWLARNVHKWKHQEAKTISRDVNEGIAKYGDGMPFAKFTRCQWLARRAELQNKPSWDDAPELANWLAQDDNGTWFWYPTKPSHPGMRGWWPGDNSRGAASTLGEVLGGWRDTLEKRPADLSEPAVIKRLDEALQNVRAAVPELVKDKYKFEPADWFERGELPPVGIECEALWNEGRMEYLRTKVFGVNEHGQPIHRFDEGPKKFEYQADPLVTMLGTRVFRPIRTERDHLIDLVNGGQLSLVGADKIADAILAAGFRRGGA